MIKLEIKKEPYWLELGSGVKVKVKPCTSAVFYEAKAYMHAKITEMAIKYKEAKDLGLLTDDLIDLENTTKREAFADLHIVIGLGLAGILEWDGVYEASSNVKAPLTMAKIEELFTHFWVIAESFKNQYSGLQEMIEAEKNGLSPDVNGTLAKGENTAKTVIEKTNSAQSKNVNTSKQT